MKSIVLAALSALSFAAAAVPERQRPDTRFTLIHLSDTHETLEERKEGTLPLSLFLSRSAGIVADVRESRPGREVLVVHSGDWLAPSITSRTTFGLDAVDRLNHLGVAVASIGNHEFDLGREAFRAAAARAQFPLVNANLIDRRSRRLIPEVRPYVVRTLATGVRVAFVSAVTTETQAVLDKFGIDVEVTDPVRALGPVVDELRTRELADVIVSLAHTDRAEDERILRALPAIDFALGGHEHAVGEYAVEKRWLFKTGSDGTSLNVVDVRPGSPVVATNTPIDVTSANPREATMAALEDRTLAFLREKSGHRLGHLDRSLDGTWATLQREARTSTPALGAWVCERLRWPLGADATLMNLGLVSRSNQIYPAGDLTRADLERMVPWFDPLVVVDTDGASLRRALEDQLDRCAGKAWSGDYPIFAGFDAHWDVARPKEQRVVEFDVAIDRRMKVAMNLYLFRALEARLHVYGFAIAPNDARSEMDVLIEALDPRSCNDLVSTSPNGRVTRPASP